MEAGQSLHQISKETGVHRDTLSTWRNRRHVYSERRTGKERMGPRKKVSNVQIRDALWWTLSQGYKGRRLNYSTIIKVRDLNISITTLYS